MSIPEAASEYLKNNAYLAKWDGQGLPPIDLLCEWRNDDAKSPEWCEAYVRGVINTEHGRSVVIEPAGGYAIETRGMHSIFRPIRSEADKKKDAAIFAIAELCRESASNGQSAELIYDAIKSGKIVIA